MNEASLYIEKGESVEVHTPFAGWVFVWLEEDNKITVAVQARLSGWRRTTRSPWRCRPTVQTAMRHESFSRMASLSSGRHPTAERLANDPLQHLRQAYLIQEYEQL
jgi:SH3-like domain-containing protein